MTEEVWYKLLPDGDANPVKVSFQSRVIDLKTAIKEDNGALNVAWMRVKTCLDGEVTKVIPHHGIKPTQRSRQESPWNR
eukprot:1415378-Amphidinium_carterae.1